MIHELLRRLEGPARVPRLKAARVLCALRPAGIGMALIDLLGSGEPATIVAALHAARGRRDDGLLAAVTDLLTHPDDDVRAEALATVIEWEPRDLDAVLLERLGDKNARVRRLAAEACVGRTDVDLVSALVKHIRPDEPAGAQETTSVIVGAIAALRDHREAPRVRDALVACLHRQSAGSGTAPYLGPPIYVAAARVLAITEAEAVLDAVRRHATSTDGYVGREAVAALTRCPAPGTVELLVTVLQGGPRKSRIAAWHALSARPFARDLLTVVDRLDGLPAETRHDLIGVARKLAERRYCTLARDERIHVRSRLTAALAITAPGQSA